MVAIDLETTGFTPRKSEILEVAAIIWVPGKEPIEWSTLVEPRKAIPKPITELTNISTDTLRAEGCTNVGEAISKLRSIVKRPETLIIGHNSLDFDSRFLAKYRLTIPTPIHWDTMLQTRADLSRKYLRTWQQTQAEARKYRTKHKVNLVDAAKYYGVDCQPHRALEDTKTVLKIFRRQILLKNWRLWKQKQQSKQNIVYR